MGPRVLLLSAPFGTGHMQAARAIAEACREMNPWCETEPVNVSNPALSLIASGYMALLRRAPSAYRSLYQAPLGGGTRRLINSLLRPTVQREIARVKPDAVLATHPFPGSAAAYLRRNGLLSAPLAVAVTDFVPHPLWVHEGVDRYFVASEQSASRLQALGVAPDRISVSGIPIRSDFAGLPRPRPTAHREILVMGGGCGLGPLVEAVRSLSQLPHCAMRVMVVCGHNEPLRGELQDLFHNDPRVEILGFTPKIPALMAKADLLVTKPGGITCSEAMACELPMLLLRPLPGHEEENAAYLTETGAATLVDENQVGRFAASLLFAAPARLALMREAARLAGTPQSARQIAHELFTMSAPDRYLVRTG